MVLRVEDLLEEARKEGGGDVAEAEVHTGCEVPRGWEEKIYIIYLSPMRCQSHFYGRNCQTENIHLLFLFLCLLLVPTCCFPMLKMLETAPSSCITSMELGKKKVLYYRGGKLKNSRLTILAGDQWLVSNRTCILIILAYVAEHHHWLGLQILGAEISFNPKCAA